MKIKEIAFISRARTHGEYSEILEVDYVHRCPKCGIRLDYKMKNWSDLKFCFNCGIKIDTKGMHRLPELLEKPIIVKNKDVFSVGEPIKYRGTTLVTTICEDISGLLNQ